MTTKQLYFVFVIVFFLGVVAGMAALSFFTVQKNISPIGGGNGGGNGGAIACTMDAMMCPDGSYVGRTGPNCEFVCPNSGIVGDIGGGATEPGGNAGGYGDNTIVPLPADVVGSGAPVGY